MSDLKEPLEDESIIRIREILEELNQNNGLKIISIYTYSGLPFEQRWSFYKFVAGGAFPKVFEPRKGELLESLEKLLVNPDLIGELKESMVEEEKISYDKNNSLMVGIPFEFEMEKISYTGDQRPGTLDEMGGKMGLVAFRTKYINADGEFHIQYSSLAPEIKPGSLIVIKKINIPEWHPGDRYLVIDSYFQIYARKLFASKNVGEVRLVSGDEKNYPEFTLSLDKTIALFRILKVIEDF